MHHIVVENKTITPSKIICIGRNYVEHIAELGNEIPQQIVVFLKPNSAISNELQSFHQEPLHYEAELCFMVEQGQLSAVGLGLDLTKRSLQSQLKTKGLPWDRAKAFDGAAVFSDFVALNGLDPLTKLGKTSTEHTIVDQLSLELKINNQVRQWGGTELMIYKPQQILTEIQGFMQLEDGDIIMTGTPKGVGVINRGDAFEGRVLFQGETLLTHQWLAK